jgi:ribose 1,5-bisphosphokinase
MTNIRGKLIYLIGASGAGKDTLLKTLREDESFFSSFVTAHRYITRPSSIGSENHIELSKAEFSIRSERGLFALEWYAHDTQYAIGKEIDVWMGQGMHVFVNGSREYLFTALDLYPDALPIWVTVDSDVLMQRLISRGRERLPEIERRVRRNQELEALRPDCCVLVDNSGDLADGIANFKNAISQNLNIA